MFHIESSELNVEIASLGAELQRIQSKTTGLDYLWDADPKFWGKHSPVLFPIIGSLKENTYFYKGKSYQLDRHGFAREMEFTVSDQKKDSIKFTLKSNAATEKNYPFQFTLELLYSVVGNQLKLSYKVSNDGNDIMFFSIGAHPAFKVPLVEGSAYNDWYLEFNENETQGRWPILDGGLIGLKPTPLLENSNRINLDKSLFAVDAIVFKGLKSTAVKLASNKSTHGLGFVFPGYSFLGIWAAKNADFVCIEPWCGIADAVNSDQQLEHKEGIMKLESKANFERSWSVNFF